MKYLLYHFRSVKLVPGEPESIIPPADLRITNIALGDEIADDNARTSVSLIYQRPAASDESDDEDEEEKEEKDEDEDVEEDGQEIVQTFLGSLTPGKVWAYGPPSLPLLKVFIIQIEHAMVDLILEKDEEILLEAVGKKYVRHSCVLP